MQFNSFSFVFFFAAIWCATKYLNRNDTTAYRNVFLLAANMFFYAWLDWKFLIWPGIIIAVNYFGGLWLERSGKQAKAKLTLIIILSLLPLAIFKYSGFITGNLAALFGYPVSMPEYVNRLILPVGLSFFTFQALTYSIDLYRKKIAVEKNFVDFALFVSFFPTLLSGPITKSRDLLPQLKQTLPMNLYRFMGGFQQFVWGLFKKCVVADRLAQYVDEIYALPSGYSGKSLALAAVCYSIQIYCDFSGYSDMAMGSANALGIELKKNFDFPYFATGIREFWKRWHIALTSWFTEYLYFSCGGSRVGTCRRVLNVMLVFLVSGLWHGANWTFIIWGGLHGIFYLIEFAFSQWKKEQPCSILKNVSSWMLTFAAVTAAWVFFRAPDFGTAGIILKRIFTDWNGQLRTGASSFSFAVMLLVTGFAFLTDWVLYKKTVVWNDGKVCSGQRLFFCVLLLLGIELLAVPDTQFVYFLF